jgi:superfamily II DNA or RNA helicase
MQINLYDYQQQFYIDILRKLEVVNKVCGVLPTGGGKSVVIGKLANELEGRTLILTHRIEILTQNSEWLNNVGLLSSKINTLKYNNKTVIAMVQTLDARIKKHGIKYIGPIDNIILDEVQILIFEKVFKQYNFKKLIGLTATPVLNKKKYTTIDDIEFVEPFTLSEIFDDIVQGPDTQDLINKDKLVQDYNIVLNLPDFNKLKESDTSPDGYTKKSLDEVYSNTASIEILSKAYNKYCEGKKTLIFNSSTKVNEFVYKIFKDKGLNVKMFDSVSKAEINPETNKCYTRNEIIDWFKNEKDAILINVNVFTTGFNVTDVECVIVNRATKSLSLWLQMVGRGSRTTDKILKDFFTVIDLGQNIHNHGRWSAKRNWEDYFYSPGKKRKKIIDLLDVWQCKECESFVLKGEVVCGFCGTDKTEKEKENEKKLKEGELVELNQMPPPKSRSIIDYTIKLNENSTFAFNLLERRIIDLFIYYNVSKEVYRNRFEDYLDSKGQSKKGFKTRVKQIYLPIYFAIIKSVESYEMNTGPNNRLEKMLTRMYDKINKLYE